MLGKTLASLLQGERAGGDRSKVRNRRLAALSLKASHQIVVYADVEHGTRRPDHADQGTPEALARKKRVHGAVERFEQRRKRG